MKFNTYVNNSLKKVAVNRTCFTVYFFCFSEIEGGRVLPGVEDICASYQYALTKHLVRQTHKAMIYIDVRELLPAKNKTLVFILYFHNYDKVLEISVIRFSSFILNFLNIWIYIALISCFNIQSPPF